MYSDVRMGKFARLEFYLWAWRLKNRARRAVKLAAIPKYCCRQPTNLKQVEQVRLDLTCKRCSRCGCRHFEQVLDPAAFGLVG